MRNMVGFRLRPRRREVEQTTHRRSTAVVLSGGGHLGAVQVGMLQALVEHDVRPDVYVACSVGALNAVAMCAYPGAAGVDCMRETWLRLRTEDIFQGTHVRHAWKIARRHDHLYSNGGLIRLITSYVPVTHFHHLQLPLRVVATEISTGEETVFAAGPLLRPLLATTALPGVFPPVRIGNETYVDGGVVNNVPISHVAEADRVFVLNVSDLGGRHVPSSTFGLLLRSFMVARANRFRMDLDHYGSQTDLVVLPQPELPPVRFPELSHTPELIALGYESASRYLDRRLRAAPSSGCA
jgi:NTE family protein